MRDEIKNKLGWERLPKWARQEIERLDRDLDYYKARVAAGPENSRVFANPYSDVPTPLGDADITFLPTEDTRMTQGFKVGLRENPNGETWLEVYGGDSLAVFPQSSNVVKIKLHRFGS